MASSFRFLHCLSNLASFASLRETMVPTVVAKMLSRQACPEHRRRDAKHAKKGFSLAFRTWRPLRFAREYSYRIVFLDIRTLERRLKQ